MLKIKKIGLVGLSLLSAVAMMKPVTVKADNPIVQTCYTTDPAPMVDGDTLYVYTGHDEDGADYYDMREIRCYSTKDMVNWTDHGTMLTIQTFSWAKSDCWASQCIERDGKYYLYVPVIAKQGGNSIGVAVADSPTGPFKDAIGKPLCSGWSYIDPTVYIDTDGQAYLYWGNGDLWYAKLSNNMTSLAGPVVKCPNNADSFGWKSGRNSSYEEGPWFYKRGNLYYMIYAAGGIPEHIAYSTSSSPTGPWKYRGVIMESEGRSFTNHPGIVDFKGNSYFFYHNGALPGGSGFARSVCVEQFTYNPDGTIPKMKMGSGVRAIATLNPYVQQEAETICFSSGVKSEKCGEGTQNVAYIENGDWIKVSNVDFGNGAKAFEARVASPNGGASIEIRLGGTSGRLVGTCSVPKTGDWQKYVTSSCTISGVTGIQDLYFVFKGGSGSLLNFNWWKFTGEGGNSQQPSNPQPSNPQPSNPVVTTSVTDGWYYIKSVSSQKYLTVNGNNAGANVELRTGDGSTSQKWKVTSTGDGYFTLTSGVGDFMMDVSYGKDEDGANIGIYNAYSGDAQRYVAQKTNTDGIFTIGTKASNGTKVLDVYEKRTADGTNIVQWTRNAGTNQQFVFEAVQEQNTQPGNPQPSEPQPSNPEPSNPQPSNPQPSDPQPSDPQPSNPGSLAGLAVTTTVNSWGSGGQVNFKISNTGAPVNTWTLKVKKSDIKISSSWNVELKESGDYYVITPVSWNASIPTGGSVEFGCLAEGTISTSVSCTIE